MFKHIQGVYIFRQESELYNYELVDESLEHAYDSYWDALDEQVRDHSTHDDGTSDLYDSYGSYVSW